MNKFEFVIILEPGGKRRTGLCADIQVPVLQVPLGERGGSGGVPSLQKNNEKEENYKEKREED